MKRRWGDDRPGESLKVKWNEGPCWNISHDWDLTGIVERGLKVKPRRDDEGLLDST